MWSKKAEAYVSAAPHRILFSHNTVFFFEQMSYHLAFELHFNLQLLVNMRV